jgi:hypothetical protein
LQFLLQNPEGLLDIVVANKNFQSEDPFVAQNETMIRWRVAMTALGAI